MMERGQGEEDDAAAAAAAAVKSWKRGEQATQDGVARVSPVADADCCVLPSFRCRSWCCWTSRSKVDNSGMDSPGLNPSAHPCNEVCKVPPPNQSFDSSPRGEHEVLSKSTLRTFHFNDLKVATRNFRPDSFLGEGGFGCVFKGWVDEHGTAPVKPGTGLTVAVKTLNRNSLQGHNEWLAEVYYLGQLHHPNLVKLVGYCIEDDQRLLVYEFMPRGSLENHLFSRGSVSLSWATRMKIALGAAEGLAFLHGRQKPVIYRDFKAANILLDADYNAKLSDFGLAKDGPEGDKSHVSTRVMGTYGYAAPEYVMTGHLTSRSDVYSFGVVLLEILTGRKSMDKARPSGEHNLVEWARPYVSERKKLSKVIDPRLQQYSEKGAYKAASLAYLCLSRDPKARPIMAEVVRRLGLVQNMKDAT